MIRLSKCGVYTLLLMVIIMTFTSCESIKNVPYFQNIPLADNATVSVLNANDSIALFSDPRIQPNDILSIAIFTQDSKSSNAVNQVATQSLPNLQMSPGQQQGISGFMVDKEGMIELNVLGKIKVAGLTTFEARETIKEKAGLFYNDPNVQLRQLNFKITVLGEVTRPASYTIANEKVTILDALGLAGDLTIFGKRENVLLIREVDGKKQFARLNLTSSELFKTPYYYLQQNDVIYVEPTRARAAANNSARTQTITIVSALIGLAINILTRL